MEVASLFLLRKKHGLNSTQFYVLSYLNQANTEIKKTNHEIALELELSPTSLRTNIYVLRNKGLIDVTFNNRGERFINKSESVDFTELTKEKESVQPVKSEIKPLKTQTKQKEVKKGTKSKDKKSPLKNKKEKPKTLKQSPKKPKESKMLEEQSLNENTEKLLNGFKLALTRLYEKYGWRVKEGQFDGLKNNFSLMATKKALKKYGFEALKSVINHKYKILLASETCFKHCFTWFRPTTLFGTGLLKTLECIKSGEKDGWVYVAEIRESTIARKNKGVTNRNELYVTEHTTYGQGVEILKRFGETEIQELNSVTA